MTAPMTPDETRLRELADDLADRLEETGYDNTDEAVAMIRTLSDALSAERERADRAVGSISKARKTIVGLATVAWMLTDEEYQAAAQSTSRTGEG